MVAQENLPFIVPIDDENALSQALAALAQDSLLRERLGQANGAYARLHHREDAMFAAYERLYGTAMACGNPWG